jgi:hypothetical protein
MNPDYQGKVTPVRVNGCVTKITVVFPCSCNEVTVTDKPQAEKLSKTLDAMSKDLTVAISQMDVNEPTPTPVSTLKGK